MLASNSITDACNIQQNSNDESIGTMTQCSIAAANEFGVIHDHDYIMEDNNKVSDQSSTAIPMKEEQKTQRVRKNNVDFLCETPEKTFKHGCTTDGSNLNSIFPQNTPP